MPAIVQHPSSYRDPAGFLFYSDGVLYRQVNKIFAGDFLQFTEGGLYQQLVQTNLLIPHQVVNLNFTLSKNWHQTVQPEIIPFISFPYEWSFDMLKDAALLTLRLAQEAMNFGMMLKDASAYNIQLHKGKMIFIDSLSFEAWNETKPWIAYRQFCQQFLGPLAVMHYHQTAMQTLLLAYPDGVPVEVAAKLLPWRSKLHLHTYLHLHLHSKMATKKNNREDSREHFSAGKMKNLLQSLIQAVQSYQLGATSGVWSGYYNEALQRDDYVAQKKEIIAAWLSQLQIKTAIDIGANEGNFSLLLAEKNIEVIAADFDHYSINRLYAQVKARGIKNILPLVMDFTSPSPAIGVNNQERESFLNRTKVDLVLALAVVHHLAIGKNVSFDSVAAMFSKLGGQLIVEFIPKTDEKIQLMLQQKKDLYEWYSLENFMAAFEKYFTVTTYQKVGGTERILFLMAAHEA